MAENLTPQQYEFYKIMYAFKENYFAYTLSQQDVYYQYVSIMSELKRIARSKDIAPQIVYFTRESRKYPPLVENSERIKTCILSLDGTLICSNQSEMKNPSFIFNYIEDDDGKHVKRKVTFNIM